jgi:hypothetical protein
MLSNRSVKRTAVLFALFALLTASVFAGLPEKSELSLGGTYVNPKEGIATWALSTELLLPLASGHILVGPSMQFVNQSGEADDVGFLGGAVEWNLTGKATGFFLGAAGLYDMLAESDDLDNYTIAGRGGFKLPITKGGVLKIYASKVIDGYGDDGAINGALAAIFVF